VSVDREDPSLDTSPDPYWERVRALFHAASELPSGERAAFLAAECDGDAQLLDEVTSLLESRELAEDFLEPPTLAGFSAGDVVAGRYRIARPLGSGGMGEVHEAEDLDLHESVALKIIRPGIASNPRVLARFRREIQLARRVTHPNVCRIYDLARDPERQLSFVSMELLHGRTLSARLREGGRMSVAEALPIVRQLTAGLDAAHAASIVHRDFKSANVMLVPGDKGLRAVITDFGLAHQTGEDNATGESRLTDTGMLVGTPDYMAPEQLEDGPLSPATDVYALGVVLFEMVTGRLPFDGATPLSVALIRLQQPAPSPRRWAPDLDPRWESVILRCLERDPALRYAGAGEVAAALDPASPMPPRVRKPVRIRRGALLAVIASLLVIALAVYFQRRADRPAVGNSEAPAVAAAPAVAPVKVRRVVAVLGFRNLSSGVADAWLGGAFAELLSNELSATETLRLVPGDEVAQLQSDLSLREGDAIGRAALPRIRERLAADVLLTGGYMVVARNGAKQVRLDARIQDAATGDVLGTVTESGSESELFALMARAGTRLRDALGSAPLTAEATAGLRASSPATAEATRAYVEGLARLRRYDTLGARASFDRAIAADPGYPMAHAALAEALWRLGSEKQAVASADRALELASKLGREERLSIEARARVLHKDFDRAIEIYRSLLTFYPDELGYGLRLGAAQISAGKGKDAITTAERLRALPEPLRRDPAIDLMAADAYQLTHENQKQLEVAERAEIAGAASNMRSVVALARANQAYAHRDLGHPDQSVALLEDAAKIYEDIGDRAGAARCLSNLGLSLWNRGDLNAAQPLLERALLIHRQVGSRSFESRTLNNLGIIRWMKGDIGGAEKLWREALVVQRESNFLTAMAPTLSNLGGARQLQGDMDGAERFYREAIAVSRQTDDRFGELTGVSNMGELYRLRGDLAAARKPYEEALALSRKLEMQQSESYTLAAMGELALWEDDLPAAHRLHQSAIEIRQKAQDKIAVCQSQVMMANLALEEGKPAEAEKLSREAIAIFAKENATEDEALAQETLARALLTMGRNGDASAALARARSLTKDSHTLGLLSAIAASEARLLMAQGNAPGAVTRAREATAIAQKSQIVAGILDAQLVLASAEANRGRTGEARALRAAVGEQARKHGLRLIARKAAASLL
jgi:tetratricopeptide (TPR) repeat protein